MRYSKAMSKLPAISKGFINKNPLRLKLSIILQERDSPIKHLYCLSREMHR